VCPLFLGIWDGEVEGSSLIEIAVGPDLAAMASNDAIGGSEAYAGPGEFALRVQALERAEQAVGVTRVKPSTVVANEERGFAVFVGVAEFDDGGFQFGSVLPCITDEVVENDLHEPFIGEDVCAASNDEANVSAVFFGLETCDDGIYDVTKVDGTTVQRVAAGARQV
jgi:hypothetical protein